MERGDLRGCLCLEPARRMMALAPALKVAVKLLPRSELLAALLPELGVRRSEPPTAPREAPKGRAGVWRRGETSGGISPVLPRVACASCTRRGELRMSVNGGGSIDAEGARTSGKRCSAGIRLGSRECQPLPDWWEAMDRGERVC